MDWSDEAKARLEEEEKRLRLKAANLQERHGAWSLMAKQELETAADIRAALERVEEERQHKEAYFKAGREAEIEVMALRQRVEELERELERLKALGLERQEWRSRMGLSTQDVIVQRAEAAEANAALLDQAATDYRKSRDVAEAKLAVCVEALRECQRVFDHPAFTDRAGIGDVCRAALAAAKGGE